MRILAYAAAASALLLGAPAALAHQGSPNFLSQVNSIAPAIDGVDVSVLNRDDRLLLHNTSGRTVVIEGYSGEPYARIDSDGTVAVNTDSEAYYINEERDGNVAVPASADSEGEPKWRQISRTGRFEWHDHRMHWTPAPSSELPLPAIFRFAALVIVLCIAVVIVRRRRAAPPAERSKPAQEAW